MNRAEFKEHVKKIEKYVEEKFPEGNFRTIDHITRAEWIVWLWCDITEFGDEHRIYIRGHERSMHEAVTAAAQYDTFMTAKEELNE